MRFSSNNYATNDQKYSGIGSAEEIESAIHLIFEAFEVTSLHEDAVRQARNKAARIYSGEQKDRTLLVIEQLGRMMDLEYWGKRGRRTRYFLS